jgi:Tat protein secretion system quality control protein TatD with DNase activity
LTIYRISFLKLDDFTQMLQRAKNAGVEKIMVTAGSAKEAREASELVKNYSVYD